MGKKKELEDHWPRLTIIQFNQIWHTQLQFLTLSKDTTYDRMQYMFKKQKKTLTIKNVFLP